MTQARTTLAAPEALKVGMGIAVTAREAPDRPAIVSAAAPGSSGDRSFDALNARVNQLVRTLRARGIGRGDAIGLVCANRAEFAEAYYASNRMGTRLTTINWHLIADEIAYILGNCEAKAFIADARFAQACAEAAAATPALRARLAVGGDIEGFERLDDAIASESPDDIDDPALGGTMLYTSGTTGRPKGVHRKPVPPGQTAGAAVIAKHVRHVGGRHLHLCTGPLYHAAPLAFSLATPLNAGAGVVMMDGWDAARALELIEQHGITHSHMVPTMFHRLLALPEEKRRAHDLSSLEVILHGAAPCPVHVKAALIEWLGPVVYEYYAATEGWGSFVTSEQWLERPGTVGLPAEGHVEIRDDEGKSCPPGTPGTIYLRSPEGGGFEYYKDDAKTAKAHSGAFFTLGDVGYLDDDGHLYLSDRSADLIISGGVNIYPAEVDAVLLMHDAVADAATVGEPDEEWGESVVSVVELKPGHAPSDALADELIGFARERLAHYKCPRRVEFSDELPRHETGKIYRRLIRKQLRERAAAPDRR